MIGLDLINTASATLNRGVCISDRDIQIALSAISLLSRNSFDDMTDSEYDELQSKIDDCYYRILEHGSCESGATITKLAAKIRRSTGQSVGANIVGIVEFETIDYEYGEFWNISNPTKLVIPSGGGGLYQVSGNFELVNTGSPRNRAAYLYKNGNVVVIRDIAGSALRTGYTVSADIELVPTDEITMGFQSVGESTSIVVDTVDATLSIVRLYE